MNNVIKSMDDYQSAYNKSVEDFETFWKDSAKNYHWFDAPTKIHSGSFKDLNVKWFEDGTTNVSYNCLDRHLENNANKTAVIYEPNDPNEKTVHISFKELHSQVCKFANVLKANGVKKGDRVCFYMGMVPELMIGVLACTRIGAVHSVVFGGFSAASLAGRIQDCEATVLVTNDGSYRGAKQVPLKDIADEALETCPTIKTVLCHKRTLRDIKWKEGRDLDLNAELDKVDDNCIAEKLNAEDPLFILYTSGSTGKPKGLMHTTGGYMVYAGETFRNVFQMSENDIYWCTADIGWITGHTYLTYGPLLNANTTVMFEGVPTYPDAGRFWQVCEEHKITHFYTAPTAIRALQACDDSFVTKYDLSSLKVLGSVGEPINEEAWEWYNELVGKKKCPIVDTWWQTETGGIMISPLANITKLIPSFATNPLPGIRPVLVDDKGNEITGNPAEGNLCIDFPWPGMARSIWGDHNRYKDVYFSTYPGRYFTGDGAKRDENGNYRITGRVDDVINVSGHRIGTAEVEDAINENEHVVESAVVGYPHDIKGQGIYAYLITDGHSGDEAELHKKINETVNKMIGPIAKPDLIQVVSGLPKTRSGKIMRRILRKVAANEFENLGDTSTLLNPEIVDEIVNNRKNK